LATNEAPHEPPAKMVPGSGPMRMRRLLNRSIAGRIPMWTWNYLVLGPLVLLGTASFSHSIQAADLNGAWASDASVCSKVFVKNGTKISFTPDAELYGAGLIVEGNRATGAFQKCKIKSMKDDGVNVHVIAACSTGVMVSDAQFTVKIIGDNQITLSSTNMEAPLVRCAL
jgi:hypothetical protein